VEGEIAMGLALEFTTANFEQEVLASPQPTLVDFWAADCPPCRRMLPVIEQLAADNVGVARVGKVDAAEHRELALKYRIDAIPVILIFKDGQPVQRFRGEQPKARLQEALDNAQA
jgi:thioredoxin 1